MTSTTAATGAKRARKTTRRGRQEAPAGDAEVRAANAALLVVPAPILVVTSDGTIGLCNASAATLLGLERDDVEGRPIEFFVAPLRVIESSTSGGQRAVLTCELPDGGCLRVGVKMGRFPPRAPRTDRVLLLDDAACAPAPVAPKVAEGLPFDVVEILQTAAFSRRTLVIDVTVDEATYGRIVVVDGEPWWARDVNDDGVAAFNRLVFRTCADVTCTALDGPPPARNLTGAVDALLLDAARVRDEERRALDEDGGVFAADEDPMDAAPDDVALVVEAPKQGPSRRAVFADVPVDELAAFVDGNDVLSAE